MDINNRRAAAVHPEVKRYLISHLQLFQLLRGGLEAHGHGRLFQRRDRSMH